MVVGVVGADSPARQGDEDVLQAHMTGREACERPSPLMEQGQKRGDRNMGFGDGQRVDAIAVTCRDDSGQAAPRKVDGRTRLIQRELDVMFATQSCNQARG